MIPVLRFPERVYSRTKKGQLFWHSHQSDTNSGSELEKDKHRQVVSILDPLKEIISTSKSNQSVQSESDSGHQQKYSVSGRVFPSHAPGASGWQSAAILYSRRLSLGKTYLVFYNQLPFVPG